MTTPVVVDSAGNQRTAWVQQEPGRAGKFIGDNASAADAAAVTAASAEVFPGVTVTAGDADPLSALAALVVASGADWALVDGPAAFFQHVS